MYFIAIFTGFYGYIFPGNINLMVVELFRSGQKKLLTFIIALILIFESIYLLLSVKLIVTLTAKSQLFNYIEMASYLLVLVMGIWMIIGNHNNVQVKKYTFYRGLFFIIIHPQQIPFWLVMFILVKNVAMLNIEQMSSIGFVFFNALGTLMVMLFYIFFGNKLLDYFKLNILQINRILGAAYILTVLYNLAAHYI
jgi:hypothetical protein